MLSGAITNMLSGAITNMLSGAVTNMLSDATTNMLPQQTATNNNQTTHRTLLSAHTYATHHPEICNTAKTELGFFLLLGGGTEASV